MLVGRARAPARACAVPSLGARVVSRAALFYRLGGDAALDRPAHVRAGSALVRLGAGRFAIVQDDASFVAVIDGVGVARSDGSRAELVVRDVPLPSQDGVRQFDDTRGNKRLKLDLEACLALDDGALLVAFGSGSTALRERVVLVDHPGERDARVVVVEARALYAQMHAEPVFCGSELNVEGAAVSGPDVLFFQRGNGACRDERAPVDATARIDRGALVAYLRGLARGHDVACPALRDVVAWDLGAIDGTRLTFTDGVSRGADGNAERARWTAFVACAEASPDATRDGPVSGVAIGRLDDRARVAELSTVVDERGAPLLDKAEGIAFDDDDDRRAWLVVDRDDPGAPAELLELRLDEGWTP